MTSTGLEQVKVHLDVLLRHASAIISRHRNFLAVAVPATLLSLCIPTMFRDYRAYLSLGEGGLPYNPIGWILSSALGIFGRETISIELYDSMPEKRSWLAGPLPQREGPRPTIGKHVIPHRQIDQFPPESLKPAARGLIQVMHERHPTTTRMQPSAHEGHALALFVVLDAPCPIADKAVNQHRGREIEHVHPLLDCSYHALLAPQDCKEVIAKGWGERHPLSGCFGDKDLQANYLFIYAPRSEQELEIITRILEASIGYMTLDESSVAKAGEFAWFLYPKTRLRNDSSCSSLVVW
ncbi:uncharacterized protein SCHCODRAFT_02637401 [Schizophyllum commune H4-8]|uniref:Luciferase domain-containing protein n=1 Tax=Schizophyllum commune (strain H4-8 / FGSC 9210) TaxID=578458 RepID=D8QDK2_SCHCM|nr:uncharacterized protein SCHCODRAFT_02637401 [Schizophyllum commune H4-8]KAI5888686.1 hypothetical protein SCHCODRAFT_02637401 [Schizophyllum commune H4-8]